VEVKIYKTAYAGKTAAQHLFGAHIAKSATGVHYVYTAGGKRVTLTSKPSMLITVGVGQAVEILLTGKALETLQELDAKSKYLNKPNSHLEWLFSLV
jgi:hypothetical protein